MLRERIPGKKPLLWTLEGGSAQVDFDTLLTILLLFSCLLQNPLLFRLSALVLTDVMLSLTSNPSRRLNGPLQRVHRLRGQRDHVPRIHPPPLHTEQQVISRDVNDNAKRGDTF